MTVIVLRENGHLFVRPFPPSSNSLVAVDTAGELPSPSLVRPSVGQHNHPSSLRAGVRNAALSPANLRNEVDWMGRFSLLSRSTAKMALSPPSTHGLNRNLGRGHHYPFGKVLNESHACTSSKQHVLFELSLPALPSNYENHCPSGPAARGGRRAAVFNPERSWSTASARAPCIYNFIPWSTASYVLSADVGGGTKPFAAAAASP